MKIKSTESPYRYLEDNQHHCCVSCINTFSVMVAAKKVEGKILAKRVGSGIASGHSKHGTCFQMCYKSKLQFSTKT